MWRFGFIAKIKILKGEEMEKPIKDFCKEHKPKSKELGYMQHHNWMEEMVKRGEKQKQCPICKRWLFDCEF